LHEHIPLLHEDVPVLHEHIPLLHEEVPVLHKEVPLLHQSVKLLHRGFANLSLAVWPFHRGWLSPSNSFLLVSAAGYIISGSKFKDFYVIHFFRGKSLTYYSFLCILSTENV